MKKNILFSFLIMTSVAHAEFDINKGFVYGSDAKTAEKSDSDEVRSPDDVDSNTETKEKTSQMRILRFYNKSSKISDPMAEDKAQGSKIKFYKITDKTLKAPGTESLRELASTADMQSVEAVLRNLESEMGIRSMPVVGFGTNEFNTDLFIKRIKYLEHKLDISNNEETKNLLVHERVQRIQNALAAKNNNK